MKGALYLLDTSVLLALVRGNELGRFIRQKYSLEEEEPAVRTFISIVSRGEIWSMAERHGWQSKKREALEKMLRSLVTIDLNADEIVNAYAEIDKRNQAVHSGARQLSHNDMWIAATARASNASLITTDQDFLHLHPNYLMVEYIDPNSKLAIATVGTQPKIQ